MSSPPIKASDRRSVAERLFLVFFYPTILLFYVVHKHPGWLSPDGVDSSNFHLLGKSPGFWYATLYTAIVCGVCVWVLSANRNRYQRSKKKSPLSKYQRAKFTSILLAQAVAFYLSPYVLPAVWQSGGFFNDPARVAGDAAHVYVYPAFLIWGGAIYMFIVIPVAIWFFGKRYCSWFCSCGNLAETVGVLPWGAKWVRLHTPRSAPAKRLEAIQLYVLGFALFFGAMLLFDGLRLFSAGVTGGSKMNRLVIVGIGAIILVAAFAGYRFWRPRQRDSLEVRRETTDGVDPAEWAPSGAELANGNQGVGWVFGRMIGVSGAAGSANASRWLP